MTDEDPDDLPSLIRSYVNDVEVVLLLNHPDEVGTNTWGYSFRSDGLDPQAVVTALREVAATLRERLETGGGPATFYAWHDRQSGQLRCSLDSRTELELPFSNPYVTTVDASVVADDLVTSVNAGLLPWGDLRQVTTDEHRAADVTTPTVVWTARLS